MPPARLKPYAQVLRGLAVANGLDEKNVRDVARLSVTQRTTAEQRQKIVSKLMARVIEIIVSPTGETTLQTKGYAGTDCLQASRFLEQALGVKNTERFTSEFFEDLTRKVEAQQ